MAAEVSVPADNGTSLKHLHNLLTPEEISIVPKPTIDKIESYIDVKFEEFLTAKALFEAGRISSGERQDNLEKELDETTSKYEHIKAKLDASEQSLQELQTQLTMTKVDLGKTQESLKKQEYDAEDFRRKRDAAIDERDNLMNMIERRNAELERLKTDVTSLSSQLEMAINAKCEALSKNDEIQSKELSLKYKEQRMDQERSLLNNQIQSLTDELNRCNSELQTIRLNHTSRILNLETQLVEKTEELGISNANIVSLNEAKKSLTQKAESLSQKLLDQRDMENKVCQNYKKELDAKAKLADLYKSMQEDSNSKTEELSNGITELQKLLNEVTEKYGELETKNKQMELDHEEFIEKKNEIINSLKRELENANDLLQTAKNDSLNIVLEELSPSAAVASKLIKSGMSLTQIYTQLVQVTDDLMKEKEENKHLTKTIASIFNELEEKAPIVRQQQIQLEEALENNAAITQQLDSLVMECNQLRDEYAESSKISSHFQRENERLKGEMADLGRQVCFLLKEVELGRGGSLPSGDQDSATTNTSTTGSSDHSSSRVISKNLVTFGDIQELQANNQKLLKLVRDLTDKLEENERHKDQLDNGEVQSKLETFANRVAELTEAQDRQTKMVNGLIRQRDMYKKLYHENMKNHGQEIPMNLDRSDSSMDLNETNKSISAVPQAQTTKSNDIEKLEHQLAETKKFLEQLKEEHKTYKEEMITNERMLIEQQENMHKELTELTASYTKCVSQSEYNNERYKILQTNVTTYKKQIASLEDKNKAYSSTIAKHEMSLKHLRDETMNAQGKLSKAEVMLENLRQECKFLKDSESRLQTEREMFNRERQGQSLLLNNLELIKASIERNEGEGKIRLEARLDEANRECSALRRRLQEEQDRFRELTSHLERATEQAKSRMEDEKTQAEKLKVELVAARDEITVKVNHIEELSKKLATAINPTNIDGSFDSKKRLKELESQINDKDKEIISLQEQLTVSKEHIKQYCDISECAEKELKVLDEKFTEYKTVTEGKLSDIQTSEHQLREKCDELEAELSLQSNGQHVTTSGLKTELQKAQDALKAALLELNDKNDNLNAAHLEIVRISKNVQIAEEKYGHEMVLHSHDIQALTLLKEQLSKMNEEIDNLTSAKIQAIDSLNEFKISWKEHENMLIHEKEDIQSRLVDLNKQNSLLLDQIQALSTQLALAHASKHSDSFNESSHGADASMNRSLNEDDVKSSDQLLQIIKYLRKEKDIIVAKFDIMQAENMRIKSQMEVTEKKLDEAKLALMSEREKSEVNTVTVTKHSEILRKVETLNAITDSNMILREERDSLLVRVNELSESSKKLEEALSPIQEKNREFSARIDSLQSENVSLKAEAGRWRTRVNALVERANKTSPEDWKRLQNEREILAKMLTTEKENIKKLNEEATVIKLEKTRLEEQINNLNKQHISQTEEFKKQTEELNTVKKDIARVTQELGEKTEENSKMTENMTTREAVLTDIRNKELQIRKIAKKYKTQYEELVKTVEEDKKKSEMLATEAAMSTETQQEEKKELEQKLTDLEKAHADRLLALSAQVTSAAEENKKLFDENKLLQIQINKNDEKGKILLKTAKAKIVQITEENNNITKELTEIKSKVESFEQNKEENDTRYGLLKSQYDARFARLEKEKSEVLQEKQQEIARLQREMESLLQKVNQLQRQLGNQQAAKPSTSTSQGDKVINEPPTANIKPMAGVGSQQSVGGRRVGGETPFASIRPMASQRTAAVLPTSAQPASPAHPAGPSVHHQTPHTTGSISGDVLSTSPSSSHHTTEYMPASSSAVGVRHHPRHPSAPPPESTQDMESEVAGGNDLAGIGGSMPSTTPQAPCTAQAVPQQVVALVMPRMEPPAAAAHAHSEAQPPHGHHPHHTHHTHHQQQASSSSSSNNSSQAVTTSHAPGGSSAGALGEALRAHKRPRLPADHPLKQVPKRSRIQGFQGVTESEVEYQVPTSSQRDQEDDGVIVVDSEEEDNQYGDPYPDQEGYMEEEEPEEGEEGEEEEEAEGEEEEEEAGGLGEEEELAEEEDDVAAGREAARASNEVELVEDTSQDMPATSGGDEEIGESSEVQSGQMDAEGEAEVEVPVAPAPPTRGQQIETISSRTEGTGNNALMLGAVGSGVGSASVSGVYEDGDDGIVPSTPTLYVPRRTDGFGEAVSSPVGGSSSSSVGGGRFTFGDGGAGAGGGAMEDTHADLAAQLAPHHPSSQGDIPSITVTEPCEEGAAGTSASSEAGALGGTDEDTPTVSSQGSQPASPQQMEEGREAEASASPSSNTRSRVVDSPQPGRGSVPLRHGRGSLRPSLSPHRPQHPHRPTPIVWGSDGDGRGSPFMQRGMQRGRRLNRRPQPPFMRF